MTKALKILVSLIGMLVLLCIIAGLSLTMYFDPNDYKNQINSLVYNKTGRHLQVNGNIERSFFPWVGVKIYDAHLSNAVGFSDQPDFLNVAEIDVRLEVMPLLSHKIEISEVLLQGLNLYLAKSKDGKSNWEDFSPVAAENDPVPADRQINTEKKLFTLPAFELHMQDVKIADSNIFWSDAETGQHLELKNTVLRASDIAFNKPFPLSTHFTLVSAQPAFNGDFSFSATTTLSPEQQQYHLDTIRFAQTAEGQVLPKFLLMADAVHADIKSQVVKFSHMLLTSGNFTATTELEAKQIATNPVLTGHIQVAEFNLKDFLKSIGKPFSSQDPTALQRVSVSSAVEAGNNSFKLSNLAITLDDSVIRGGFNLRDLSKKGLNFALDVNQINLDRYMPASEKKQVATGAGYSGFITSAAAEITSPAAASDPWSALRELNAAGSIRVGSLTFAKTVLTEMVARCEAENAVLSIPTFTANVYQGNMDGQMQIDLRGTVPQYTLDGNLTNVQVGQLLSTDRISGTANLKAHLTLQGNAKQELLSSLNGNMQLSVTNGSFIGLNLANFVDKAFDQVSKALAVNPKNLPSQIQAKTEPNARTDFAQLSASGIFQNGNFSNNDLLMQSSVLKVTGSGVANLVAQTLNYRLNAVGMHNAANTQLTVTLPLLVTGTFSQPLIVPDIRALTGTLLREKIHQKLQQINTNEMPIIAPAVREKAEKFLQKLQQ